MIIVSGMMASIAQKAILADSEKHSSSKKDLNILPINRMFGDW